MAVNPNYSPAKTFASNAFNPDHVMMHELKDGTIIDEFNGDIMQGILENSKIMQLAKYQQMNGTEKTFTFWADKPGAYWVGEGQKIATAKPSTVTATLKTHKLGVIVLASREFLNYTYRDFFNAMKPQIIEAFNRKFDEAAILNVDNPFEQSIEESVVKAGNVVTGAVDYNKVLELQDKLIENDFEANALISKTSNKSALRGVRDPQTQESLYDRNGNVLDGIQVVDLKSTDMPKGTVYAGDFNHAYYGIPYNINFSISEEAQLSTITNEDGSPVNLYEQELIAMRATMDVAFLITNDEAFAKLAPSAEPEV